MLVGGHQGRLESPVTAGSWGSICSSVSEEITCICTVLAFSERGPTVCSSSQEAALSTPASRLCRQVRWEARAGCYRDRDRDSMAQARTQLHVNTAGTTIPAAARVRGERLGATTEPKAPTLT